jgi:polar amino acid transport system substrate-binding protein
MKTYFFSISFFVFSLFIFSESYSQPYRNLDELKGGKVFAVPSGTVADQFVLKRFPDAKIEWYNSIHDCALAVSLGKADATVYDKPVLQNLASKTGGLLVLEELLLPDRYGFAVNLENKTLKTVIDNLLIEMKQNGEYEKLVQRWMPQKGEPGPMPDFSTLNNNKEILFFGTAAVTEPMSFVGNDQKISGFDIELAYRVAQKLGKKLEVVNMEFGAMIPALVSGKVEMIGAGLSITEERAKSVLFSMPNLEGGLAVLVKAGDEQKSESASDLEKIGVLTGSIHEVYALKNFPDAQILTYNTVSDMLTALDSDKVEAAFMDDVSTTEVFASNPGFTTLEKDLFTVDIAAGFADDADELRLKFNQFLSSLKTNGTYKEMVDRWMNAKGSELPEITSPNTAETLRIGIVSDLGLPFATKNNDDWKGFDAELSMRFAAWLGKKPVMTDMPFGSLIPSLVSGKIDLITSSMMVTEEREKSIDFSDPYFASGISIIGKKSTAAGSENIIFSRLEDIHDKRVGIFSGTIHDAFMAKKFPDAQLFRFESTPDMMLSLTTGKIDAAMFDLITAKLLLRRTPELGLLTDDVLSMNLGVGFSKDNQALLTDFNAFLNEIRADKTYDKIHERWFVQDAEQAVMPVFPDNPDGKKLVVGVSIDDLPYVAFMNDQYVGFDIEMIRTFADRRKYNLEIVSIEFPALIAALSSGKVDMITDGIAISEERGKEINFSDPYAIFKTAVVVHKKNLAGFDNVKTKEVKSTFLTKLINSFKNNLIREKRYMMILKGLLITIIISILAAVTGTILGGLVCYMRMSKNKTLSNIALSYISLIRGTPVLVLLMIIYYVVFASVNINPVLVAIIAFGINFAAYVSEMFRSGIESIDKGQKEAGIALGFTKIETFIHIIMPQAMRQVLPVYKGEFISLVKMTSIVGYIAVEDLTKASDIIRSRTFDAFFPLIMAAVIYILISWMLTLVLDYVEFKVDPKKRRVNQRKEILS